MPTYVFKGRNRLNEIVVGERVADTRDALRQILRREQVTLTSVKEKGREIGIPKLGGRKKVKSKDLSVFTRQFSVMIDAGLPLVQCLEILAQQQENKYFQQILLQVRQDVEEGSTLAAAMARHPRVFDQLYSNMVEAGETGGILDVVLQRLSQYIEKAAALKRKVKAAMIYPATIIGVAFLVVIFMLTFVIPTFASMFKGLGAELPLPTQIVLWLSDFVRGYILLIIAAIAGAVYALRRYYKTEGGRGTIDALALKVPVFGTLIRKVSVARFTRTFGTLVSSGVPILEGLRITARTAGNRVVEKAVMQCRAAVTAGKTLSEPLKASGVFPPMVTQMISVGEQTGALDAMLSKIADFYDDEVDTAVGALTALLEPLMIVFLGVVIGGLVVAMYLPIFRLVTLIK